jgi:hypothetical protein
MKRIVELVRRLFRKKEVYVADRKDLEEILSTIELSCRSCKKRIVDAESVSRLCIRDGEIYVICTACKG